jgi:nucleotide-binding universal stress UspA family protein
MKKILVAVDFSASSLNALSYAAHFAADTSSELYVMTVYNTINYTPVLILGDINKNLLDESTKLKEKLSNTCKKACGNLGVKYHVHTVVGVPEIEIQKFARKLKTSLIIMGQTGNGGLKRYFLGSTTSHVINTSSIPVLIIPPNKKYKPIKNIIFTTDLEPSNISFLKYGAEFARYFNAKLTLLFIDVNSGYNKENIISKMENLIQQKFKYANIKGVICSDFTVENGISYYLQKHKADIAILVKHHPTLHKAFKQGSNSGKIADKLTMPALIMESKK